MGRIREQRMKKNPASIERNATASAEQSTSENGNAAENIFHSKQPETENNKEKQTMKTTKTPARPPRAVRQYEAIRAHGDNLLAIFPNATERDPVSLCKRLRRLEAKASRICLDYCNGAFDAGENGEKLDAALDAILAKVNAILGNNEQYPIMNAPIFINRDPRGYALKIADAWMNQRREQWDRQIAKQGKKAITEGYWALLRFHRDWGGYGILAPEITGD